jgi:hypothetical protein
MWRRESHSTVVLRLFTLRTPRAILFGIGLGSLQHEHVVLQESEEVIQCFLILLLIALGETPEDFSRHAFEDHAEE